MDEWKEKESKLRAKKLKIKSNGYEGNA